MIRSLLKFTNVKFPLF